MDKIKAFCYGIIAAFGATFLQLIALILLNVQIIDTSHLSALLVFGALSEEIFKLIVIYYLAKEKNFSQNIVLDSLLVGLGFSITELVFKIWGDVEIIRTNFWAYLGIVFIHLLTAGIMGWIFSVKKSAWSWVLFSLMLALTVHLAYNAVQIYYF